MTATSEPRPPLIAELAGQGKEAFAGILFPITVRLKIAAEQTQSVRVCNVECTDKEIQLDSDLMERNVEIRPGESYFFTIKLNVSRVREVDLSTIYVQIVGRENDLFPLPNNIVQFRPSLEKDIVITSEPICSYENVTKLQLTFRHNGVTPYKDFRISFGPDNVVHAAKQEISWPVFNPNDKDMAMVAASGDLHITLKAMLSEGVIQAQKLLPVRPVEPRNGTLFRFLEPDRLSSDQVVIRDKSRKGDPVGLVRSAFPLVGGGSYQIVIRPHHPDVTNIQLQDVPGSVYVRSSDCDPEEGGWKFDIDVPFAELLTRSERLVYKVTSKDGPLTGEIHLNLTPPAAKRWRFAIAVGVAATAQGVAAMARVLLNPDTNLEEFFTDIGHKANYTPLLVLAIPVAWVVITVYDRLQIRLRT